MEASIRQRVEARLVALRDELRGGGVVDVASEIDTARKLDDDAAPLEEMSKVIASNRNKSRADELRAIDAALARLRADPEEFGCCEACGEDIGVRRLELMPWVHLCIECQEAEERDGVPGGARRHLTDFR